MYREELNQKIKIKEIEDVEYDRNKINAIWKDAEEFTSDDIKYWIPSFKNKHKNKLRIINGELVIIINNSTENELMVAREIGMNSYYESVVNGHPSVLPNSAGKNLISYKIYGDSTQMVSLFDLYQPLSNGYIQSNGVIRTAVTTWLVTDYIEVNEGETYEYYGIEQNWGSQYYNWYDADKNIISTVKQSTVFSPRSIKAPAGAKYVAFSLYLTDFLKFHFNKVPTIEKPVEIKSLGDDNQNIRVVTRGKNLFNYPQNPTVTGQAAMGGYGSGSSTLIDNGYALYGAIGFALNDLLTLKEYSVSCDVMNLNGSTSFYYGLNMPLGIYHYNKIYGRHEVTSVINRFSYVFWAKEGSNIAAFGDLKAGNKITNIQVEYGRTATSYQPYVTPVETIINLSGCEKLRKVENSVDYIDYEKNCIVRNVGCEVFTGSSKVLSDAKPNGRYICTHKVKGSLSNKTIDLGQSATNVTVLYELNEPVYESIMLPSIPTLNNDCVIEVWDNTNFPSSLEVKYITE